MMSLPKKFQNSFGTAFSRFLKITGHHHKKTQFIIKSGKYSVSFYPDPHYEADRTRHCPFPTERDTEAQGRCLPGKSHGKQVRHTPSCFTLQMLVPDFPSAAPVFSYWKCHLFFVSSQKPFEAKFSEKASLADYIHFHENTKHDYKEEMREIFLCSLV